MWLNENDVNDGKKDISELLSEQFFTDNESCQLATIDLQSLRYEEERLLVVNRILSLLWDYSKQKQAERITSTDEEDERVPIFVVIDEAQNFIPTSTDNPLLQKALDQLIKIAAEGRKYGTHLIVATQRPKKVHPSVLSECDNLCLLRMTSDEDLSYARSVLGYFPMELAKNSLNFKTGDALLAGGIVGYNSMIIHTAPRRTVEGGSSLSDNWARPREVTDAI
jgi:DNA helicase HerA-like ATPase